MFGLNIFIIARGAAMISAMIDAFVSAEYSRNEFMEIESARVITTRNQILITVFHLYFIRMKISANARANAETMWMSPGFSSSGVSNPKGSPPSPGMISFSPVAGL